MKESLKHFFEESKPRTIFNKMLRGKDEIILIIVIILVGVGGFGLGRLSVKSAKKDPISIIQNSQREGLTASVSNSSNLSSISNSPNVVVASRNGSIYHLPWCSGALKIKPENLITFNNIEEAEKAGYKKAANCNGL